MHRALLTACCVTIVACAAIQDDGRIPITTRSTQARDLYLRARAANENLQVHEAHALFGQAVAADSSFALGEYGLAATAPTAREQVQHLERALSLSASVSPGERLLMEGLKARANGDPARNLVIVDSLTKLYPRDERAHWFLAVAWGARQQYDSAIAQYERAIALNPSFSLAYNQLGYAFRSANQLDSAERIFRQYIALVPRDPNPYDSYAELLMKMGRFEESITQYRRALAIDPHFGGSFVGIASNAMYLGRYADAVAEARAYLAGARDDGERRTALLTLAMIYVDEGATDSALAAIEQRRGLAAAIGDAGNMAGDDIIAGDILLDAGRLDAAGERYARAHQQVAASRLPADAKDDDALARHYDLARVALARHDLPVARSEAEAYLVGANQRHHDVRIRQAHELVGLLALHDRQYDGSLAELAQADQQNPAVLLAASRAYAGKGDVSRARELANEAGGMNILPTLPYVFTRRALRAAGQSAGR